MFLVFILLKISEKEQLKAVKYFRKRAPSLIFNWVLITRLTFFTYQLASDAFESEHDAQSKDKHELLKVASKDKKGGGKKGDRKSPPKASKIQVNTPTCMLFQFLYFEDLKACICKS